MARKLYNKYQNLNILVKATIWFTVAMVVQKSINFITMPIFTRIMSPSDYGLFTMYNSWLNIFLILTTLKLDASVFNKSMFKYEKERNGFVATIQLETTILAIIFIVLYLLFYNFFSGITELPLFLAILLFSQLIVQPAYNFWILRERYEYHYIKFLLVVLLTCFLNVAFGIGAVLIFSENKGIARIISYVLINLIFGIVIYIYNMKKGIKEMKKEYAIYATKFNLPLLPHYISQYILDQLDRIMIQKIINTAAVAIYNSAYNISMVFKIFTDSLISAITPWYYEQLKNKKYEKISKLFNSIFFPCLIIIVLFSLLAPEIIKILLPVEYYNSIYIIPPVSMSILFLLMYSSYSLIEFYFDANKFSMIASMIGALLNFILNYIFIKKYGYLAAGWTTMVCYLLFAIAHFYYSKHIFFKNTKKYLFDDKYIFKISLIIIISSIVIIFTYKYLILRIILMIIMLLVLYINRKYFFNIFNKIVSKEIK